MNLINFIYRKASWPDGILVLFFKNLKFLGYRYFNKKFRRPSDKRIIIAFQSKYLPKNISGFIDEKTYIISQLLAR